MTRIVAKKFRAVHGILLLNKPLNMTSNAALQQVKRLYQAKKAGHTGSLDPLATGLLPLCFGEATKISHFLLAADKRYRTTCKLGVTTTTADSEGEIIQQRTVPELNLSQIKAVLSTFIGEQEQIPPMYSALKHNGQPLYKLARAGQEVSRQARLINIYAIDLIEFIPPNLSIEVHCSKGTYVRTLVEDIGEKLGCGAHVTALHRSAVGHYTTMLDWPYLQQVADTQGNLALDALLLTMDSALPNLPSLSLSPELVYYIQQGQAVQIAHAPTEGWVKLFDQQQQLIALGQILDDGRVAPKRLIIT
jgi:tRNA pseudouridine55 synthase